MLLNWRTGLYFAHAYALYFALQAPHPDNDVFRIVPTDAKVNWGLARVQADADGGEVAQGGASAEVGQKKGGHIGS